MSREEALRQLEELRSQLLVVYECSETCEHKKNRLDALTEERINPAQLSFTPDATDEEATLRTQFEEKNSRKLLKGWGIEALLLVVLALVLAGVCVAMYFDISAGTGILISPEHVAKGPDDIMNVMILQAIMSVAALVIALATMIGSRG